MDLKEFKDFVIAQRLAENKEKRNANLNAMMKIANATNKKESNNK